MKITILTLFPEMFKGFLESSIIGRAQEKGIVQVEIINLRDFSYDSYGSVDDKPYGGGPGMVLRVDIVAEAIKNLKSDSSKVILLTPQGKLFNQKTAQELSKEKELLLVSGHYEGFDERIRDFVDLEISIGDYVLTGGELPAAVLVDAITRLLPGSLGKEDSAKNESFDEGLLEYPQYTRPEVYEGRKVPKVLLSGNHMKIDKWRKSQSLEKTKKRRPDLLRE